MHNFADLKTIGSLLKKGVVYSFEKEQKEAISTVKATITSNSILRFFNLALEIEVQEDV